MLHEFYRLIFYRDKWLLANYSVDEKIFNIIYLVIYIYSNIFLNRNMKHISCYCTFINQFVVISHLSLECRDRQLQSKALEIIFASIADLNAIKCNILMSATHRKSICDTRFFSCHAPFYGEARNGKGRILCRDMLASLKWWYPDPNLLRFDITEYNGKLCELCDFEKGPVSRYTCYLINLVIFEMLCDIKI